MSFGEKFEIEDYIDIKKDLSIKENLLIDKFEKYMLKEFNKKIKVNRDKVHDLWIDQLKQSGLEALNAYGHIYMFEGMYLSHTGYYFDEE